ncbi:hypothetical protein EDC01DRAFT_776952 [Geopyxis carbonaria]|nr:hypothetical protein EDC01DRAFT_776952 [Geopyxis carbonaria]
MSPVPRPLNATILEALAKGSPSIFDLNLAVNKVNKFNINDLDKHASEHNKILDTIRILFLAAMLLLFIALLMIDHSLQRRKTARMMFVALCVGCVCQWGRRTGRRVAGRRRGPW